MKKKALFCVLLFFISSTAFAQLDDILKKTKEIPILPDFSPQGTVTTSINDAFPVVPWLDNFDEWEPQPVTDFNLAPGYYRTTIQTYCLHAGAYGPTQGSGYLIAPLKGSRADMISSILLKSEDHPEIQQQDIQQLIWGIEAGVKFTDYPADFQARVQPLLTAAEIAELNVDVSAVFDNLPEGMKDMAGMYKDLRRRLVDPSSNYQQIEQIAVQNGIPPIGPGSKTVNPGNWTYMKDGFYIRTFPNAYFSTVIEIYRPAAVNSQKDSKDRLTLLENEGYRMEITYNDDPGMDILSTSGNPDVPIWRIKQIVLKGPDEGQEMTLDNPGWIVAGDGSPINKGGSNSIINSTTMDDPSYGDYQGRVQDTKRALKNFDKYQKERNQNPSKQNNEDFENNKNIYDGLKAATNPLNKKGQLSWISKNLNMVKDWWNNSSNALAGRNDNNSNDNRKFNPTHFVSTPGNTNAQRLGMSSRFRTD
jgi:hypothetical protein